MTAERRQPIRIAAGVSYRELEPGICERPEHYGSDLWIIEGDTETGDNNSAAERLCVACPIRSTCAAEAEAAPHRYRGTIRGALAYFKSGKGKPFLRCESPTCTRTFASARKNVRYCSRKCVNAAESARKAEERARTKAPAPTEPAVTVPDTPGALRQKAVKLRQAGLPVPLHVKAGEREYERSVKARRRERTPAKPQPELQPCGTTAAYRRHQRHGEPTDQLCRDAYAAERKNRRGAA